MIAAKVSAVSVLLLAGLYVSSMSSCLGAMYGTPRVLQSVANENVIPGIGVLGKGVCTNDKTFTYKIVNCWFVLQRGPNKVPIAAMIVVAIVTLTFILIGEINTLGPIVTMPFLLTYACIDYAYFALAQTFDIQHVRETRFRQSNYQTTEAFEGNHSNSNEISDLDSLFPERTQHKLVGVS